MSYIADAEGHISTSDGIKTGIQVQGNVVTLRAEKFVMPQASFGELYSFYARLAFLAYHHGGRLIDVKSYARIALGYANRLKCPRRKAACLKVLGIIRRKQNGMACRYIWTARDCQEAKV